MFLALLLLALCSSLSLSRLYQFGFQCAAFRPQTVVAFILVLALCTCFGLSKKFEFMDGLQHLTTAINTPLAQFGVLLTRLEVLCRWKAIIPIPTP